MDSQQLDFDKISQEQEVEEAKGASLPVSLTLNVHAPKNGDDDKEGSDEARER